MSELKTMPDESCTYFADRECFPCEQKIALIKEIARLTAESERLDNLCADLSHAAGIQAQIDAFEFVKAERDEFHKKFEGMVRLNDANLECYNNCAKENATLKAQVKILSEPLNDDDRDSIESLIDHSGAFQTLSPDMRYSDIYSLGESIMEWFAARLAAAQKGGE
jgi:hypothetical protein